MIIYIILSFFLENIFSLLFNYYFVIPLFFLISLIIYYQTKNVTWEKYLLYIVLLGFIYDIVYTNIYINSLLFLIIGSLNILYKRYLNNSLLMNIFLILFSLISYEIIYYLIYVMLGLNYFSILVLLKSFIKVIPVNICYYLISYLFINRIER